MSTKHFFKILTLFTTMIVLGLIGVFVANYFENGKMQTTSAGGEEVAR